MANAQQSSTVTRCAFILIFFFSFLLFRHFNVFVSVVFTLRIFFLLTFVCIHCSRSICILSESILKQCTCWFGGWLKLMAEEPFSSGRIAVALGMKSRYASLSQYDFILTFCSAERFHSKTNNGCGKIALTTDDNTEFWMSFVAFN